MKHAILKRIFGMLALLGIIGAFSLCAFTVIMPANGADHAMPATQEVPMAHSLHFEELTASTSVTISLALFATLLPIVFALFSVASRDSLLSDTALSRYLRQKFYDILYIVKQTIQYWLSLFEVSPNGA